MDSIICPHCGNEALKNYKYCRSCTRLIESCVECLECTEPISKNAKKCPYCGHRKITALEQAAYDFEMRVEATRLGAALAGDGITALFFPPIVEVSKGKATLTRWSFYGLRKHQAEMKIDRIASVRYTKGIIWGGIFIETFGGATADLVQNGLTQKNAKLLSEKLKEIINKR